MLRKILMQIMLLYFGLCSCQKNIEVTKLSIERFENKCLVLSSIDDIIIVKEFVSDTILLKELKGLYESYNLNEYGNKTYNRFNKLEFLDFNYTIEDSVLYINFADLPFEYKYVENKYIYDDNYETSFLQSLLGSFFSTRRVKKIILNIKGESIKDKVFYDYLDTINQLDFQYNRYLAFDLFRSHRHNYFFYLPYRESSSSDSIIGHLPYNYSIEKQLDLEDFINTFLSFEYSLYLKIGIEPIKDLVVNVDENKVTIHLSTLNIDKKYIQEYFECLIYAVKNEYNYIIRSIRLIDDSGKQFLYVFNN